MFKSLFSMFKKPSVRVVREIYTKLDGTTVVQTEDVSTPPEYYKKAAESTPRELSEIPSEEIQSFKVSGVMNQSVDEIREAIARWHENQERLGRE